MEVAWFFPVRFDVFPFSEETGLERILQVVVFGGVLMVFGPSEGFVVVV